MKPKLSIVIPAYNEAANFRAGLLTPSFEWLKKQEFSWEVLFVDDGSTDETPQLLKKFCTDNKNTRLLQIAHGGKVAAVRSGMLAATGKIVLFTDFDQSTPLSQVERFIQKHKRGFDAVIGDRGIMSMDNSLFRRFRSWVFVTLVQVLLVPGIHDSQCGFKSFKNAAAKTIFQNLLVTNQDKVVGGYMGAWDVEALFLANKMGYKIAQMPVQWRNIEGTRLNPVTEPLKMLRDIVKIRLYDLMGKYDHHPNTTAN